MSKKQETSVLSYTHLGTTITIEIDRWDLTTAEFKNMCEQMALAAGYSTVNVNEEFHGE